MKRVFWRGFAMGTAMSAVVYLVQETYGADRPGREWLWLGGFVIAGLLAWGYWRR